MANSFVHVELRTDGFLAETTLFAPDWGARRESQANLAARRTCIRERW